MIKLSVIIYVHGESEACMTARKTAKDYYLEDTEVSVAEGRVDLSRLDYKHLGILITEDPGDMDFNDNEFLHTVFLGSKFPHVIGSIQAVINPEEEKRLFKHQLKYAIDSLINKYRLELTWNMLDTTINSVPDLVWYKALNGDHFNVNTPFCNVVGKTKDDIEGRKHPYIWDVSEDEAYACQESEEKTLEAGRTCSFEELVNTPDGLRTMITYKTPLRTAKGTVIATAGIAQDVTRQREYEDRLQQMAATDPLSGLYNRRYLYQIGDSRYIGDKTVIYLDIDFFKEINDNFGHDKGDSVIRLVSREMKNVFPGDVVARMGGDEFIILSSGLLPDSIINERFESMQKAFESSEEVKGFGIHLSRGVYRGSDNMEEAVTAADALMYQNKRKHHEERKKR